MTITAAQLDAQPEHEPEFYLPSWAVSEADIRELAAGRVPEWLQEVCRRMADWTLETGQLSFEGLAMRRQRRRTG